MTSMRYQAVNLSVMTAAGPTIVATNLFTDPSFEASSGTAAVFQNTALNPMQSWASGAFAGEHLARWGWVTSGQTGSGLPVDSFTRLTVNQGSVGTSRGFDQYINMDVAPGSAGTNPALQNAHPVTAGVAVTMSVMVRVSKAATMSLYFRTHDGTNWAIVNGVGLPATVSPGTAVPANAWTKLTFTYTPPITGFLSTRVSVDSTGWVSTDYLDMTMLSYTLWPAPYVDPTCSADADIYGVAAGTVGASVTTATATVVNAPVSWGVAIQSTQWSDTREHSARLLSTTPGHTSYISLGGNSGAIRLGMQPGATYTAQAVCHAESADATPQLIAYTMAPSTGSSYVVTSAQAPSTPGDYPLSITFTIPVDATEAFIRLFGSSIVGESIYWDSVIVSEGDVYFDGSQSPDRNLTPAWTGLADASTSTLSHPTFWYNVEGGTVSFDEAWTPYLQASVLATLPMTDGVGAAGRFPDRQVLDTAAWHALDPRMKLRGVLVATTYVYDEATGVLSSQDAVAASLRISSRSTDWKAGTVEILLTSDEFVLQTEANRTIYPTNYRQYQKSLIAVVNACLADAGLSATLDASSVDADVTTTLAVTNLAPDPNVSATTDWAFSSAFSTTRSASGGPVENGPYAQAVRTPASAGALILCAGTGTGAAGLVPGTVGQRYTLTVYVWCSVATKVTMLLDAYKSDGVTAQSFASGTNSASLAAATWQEVTVGGVFPAGFDTMVLYMQTDSVASGAQLRGANSMIVAGDGLETDGTPLEWFYGGTAEDAYYTYAWDGDVGASSSTRTPIVDRTPDSLTLSPGQSYMDMLEAVVTAAGRRLFCDEDGVWRLVDGVSYAAPGTVVVQPSTATAMSESIDLTQTDVVYGSVVVKYAWTDPEGNVETYYDAAGDAAPTYLVEINNQAYPGPGAAAYILAKGQGRGLVMSTTAMSDYAARPYQGARIIAPYEATQTGVVSRVDFDLPSAEMALTTRGLTDTPAGVWLLAPTTKVWGDVAATTTWDGLDNDFDNL